MPGKLLIAILAVVACGLADTPVDLGHLVASDLQAGKYQEALKLVQDGLKASPRDARLWTLEGLTFERLQRKQEALGAFQRALELAPDYLPALEGAAQIEYEAGKDDAAALVARILKLRPDDQTGHAMLAAIALKTGDCETARGELARSQSEVAALRTYGGCLVDQKHTHEAVAVFAKLSALQPENGRTLYELAVVEFLDRSYGQVIELLNSAKATHPLDGDSFELLGEAYEANADPQQALEALHQATIINPKEPRYYADAAYICQAQRAFQQGIEILNTGLRGNPNVASLYVARGILYSELAEYDQGLDDFKEAEALDPSIELSSEAQGLTDLQKNDLPEAERVARERIRQHPNDAFLYYLLGETLRKKGVQGNDYDEAVKALQKATELDPKLILARDSLGGMYLEHGEIAEAIRQSRAVYQANANDETALYHLILALRKSGKTDELPGLLKQLALLKKQSRPQDFLRREVDAVKAPQ